MIANGTGDGDPARFGNALQSRRDIDTVTKNVLAFDNHIAKIDANAEFNAAFLWHTRIPITHPALDFGGAGNRVHHARKLHHHAVARQLDDASLMLGDLPIDEIRLNRLQCGERARFVRTHEAAVANDVGGKNSSEAALHINPVTLQKSVTKRNTKMP